MKSWFQDLHLEMNSVQNAKKSQKKRKKTFVAERFIRILKYKIYNYMTSTSKNIVVR